MLNHPSAHSLIVCRPLPCGCDVTSAAVTQTLGNHEFDFGPAVLARFVGKLSFPMLGACNVDASREPQLMGPQGGSLIKKFIVKKVQGIKVTDKAVVRQCC